MQSGSANGDVRSRQRHHAAWLGAFAAEHDVQNQSCQWRFRGRRQFLNIFNGTGAVQRLVQGVGGEHGTVLRRANRGFNVPGGTPITGGPVVPAGLFPENWIRPTRSSLSANLFSNSGSSNYHSLQVQATLRPTHGLSFQGTYVWSKALAVPTTGYTNPADRQKDYHSSANHVTHDFRANGTFELPIGPNKLLLANSSGWVARLIERWQTSFIVNFSTGRPASITAGNMLYGNGVADVVGPFDLRRAKSSGATPGEAANWWGTISETACSERSRILNAATARSL